MLPTGLLVVHDTLRSSENEETELTGWQQAADPFLNHTSSNIVAGRDHTALVQAAVQLHNNLAGAMVIHKLELANIAVLHHHLQHLDDHLGRRANEHLLLSALLSVVHAFLQSQRIVGSQL